MKAIALTHYLPISDPQSLFDIELPKPVPKAHDLLVRVEAVSTSPEVTGITVQVRTRSGTRRPRAQASRR